MRGGQELFRFTGLAQITYPGPVCLRACDLEGIRTHFKKVCVVCSSKFQEGFEAIVGRRVKMIPQGRTRQMKDGVQHHPTPFTIELDLIIGQLE